MGRLFLVEELAPSEGGKLRSATRARSPWTYVKAVSPRAVGASRGLRGQGSWRGDTWDSPAAHARKSKPPAHPDLNSPRQTRKSSQCGGVDHENLCSAAALSMTIFAVWLRRARQPPQRGCVEHEVVLGIILQSSGSCRRRCRCKHGSPVSV